jgi:hypothetical protein
MLYGSGNTDNVIQKICLTSPENLDHVLSSLRASRLVSENLDIVLRIIPRCWMVSKSLLDGGFRQTAFLCVFQKIWK